jgi:MFS family permease
MVNVDPDATAVAPAAAFGGEADQPRRGRLVVFGVVAIALLMVSIDQTSVATALPSIQRDLDTSLAWSGWTITVYSLGQIIGMPVAGKLSDQFGRKAVFMVVVGVFTLTSLCAGLVHDIDLLIALRALQGLAGGGIVPSATGIVSDQFGHDRDRAIGMFTSIFPIGAIIGPIVGGVLVTYSSWRAIFLINLPLGVAMLALAAVLIGRSPRSDRAGRVDVGGIALLSGLLLSTMTAIALAGTPLPAGARLAALVVGGVIAAVIGWKFLTHARRDPFAVVPWRLLHGRAFGLMNTINLMFGAAALGFGALVPLYAENRYGILPLAAGGLLAVRAIGMIGTSALSVYLLRRTGHRRLMITGFTLLVTGLVVLAAPSPFTSPEVWLSIGAGITGLGMGVAAPASNNASLHLAPAEVASITGLRGMFRQSGAIVSISVATAILSISAQPGITQAYVFVAFAAILATAIPLIIVLPDHRGAW